MTPKISHFLSTPISPPRGSIFGYQNSSTHPLKNDLFLSHKTPLSYLQKYPPNYLLILATRLANITIYITIYFSHSTSHFL